MSTDIIIVQCISMLMMAGAGGAWCKLIRLASVFGHKRTAVTELELGRNGVLLERSSAWGARNVSPL